MPVIFSEKEVISISIKQQDDTIAYINGVPRLGLVTLYVEKCHRRKGYGEKLLLEYISKVKETTEEKDVKFECHTDNFAALALYQKLGFTMEYNAESQTCLCIHTL